MLDLKSEFVGWNEFDWAGGLCFVNLVGLSVELSIAAGSGQVWLMSCHCLTMTLNVVISKYKPGKIYVFYINSK